MTRENRILSTFVILGLLTLSLSDAARSQSTPPKTATISGSTGVVGVTLQGFPGTPVTTDENGFYSAEVPQGWAGTVTPVKLGYAFVPPSRTFTTVAESLENQDYVARLLTFTISGNIGLPGVVLQGFPQEVVSDPQGKYQAQVDYGWADTVTPKKPGFDFTPGSRLYPPLHRNLLDEDYTTRVLEFTISGTAGGIPGVTMRGFPGSPIVTDANGKYSVLLQAGWSGTVVPEKEGYRFEPFTKTYATLERNMTNESYAAKVVTFTVSGRTGVAGVLMKGLPREPVTDQEGFYKAQVPFGWSGVVRPSKEGLSFTPPERTYDSVTASLSDENYAVGERMATISDVIKAGNVLVIPTGDTSAERIAETTEDLRVMLQILREKLSEPRMIRGVLRDYGSLLGEDRRAEAIYLEGSAAMFVIGADFPPSSPAQQPDEGDLRSRPQREAADPVWQRARQKLYEPGARSPSPSGQTQTMTFEQFQEELLRSLRHAANIRHIDPNELVVLTLVAQNEGASRAVDADLMRQYENLYGNDYKAMMGMGHPAPSATVLTMQAKKADIDAFAQGTLDFDQFRQKVRSFTY